jgi:hypothetical protein
MPKTGTTAYEAALRPMASLVVSAPPELKHAPVFRYNRFFRPMLERFIGEDLTVVAVMREPLDWLGSWYRYRQRDTLKGKPNSTQGISFDDFVQAYTKGDKPPFAQVGSQAKFLEVQPSGAKATHLFRYDRLDEFQTFLETRLGVEIETERLNTSPVQPLDITDATREKFRRKCAVEYRLWQSIGSGGQYTPLDREATRGM